MNQISLRQGKVTRKSIEDSDSTSIMNVMFRPGFEKTYQQWHQDAADNMYSFLAQGVLASWGKPNVTFTDLESAPGVWILDDMKSGITWYIWSDEHHKHPWKGTSYEVILPSLLPVSDDILLDSWQRLLPMLKGEEMIHFDFTVSDEDAEVIFDCISDRQNDFSIKLVEEDRPGIRKWLQEHIEYLENLKKQMLNTKV